MTGQLNQLERTTICDGEVVCIQPRDGFRFSVDALLLAGFVLSGKVAVEKFCELGAGCGVIAAILSRRPGTFGVAVERDATMATCLRQTVAANGLADRLEARELDVRRLREDMSSGGFPLVISNPPYFRVGHGRVDETCPQAGARHELAGTMADFLSAARYLLPPRGRLNLIYPATRLPECMVLLPQYKLLPTRLQLVHQRAHRAASHFLLEASKSAGPELVVEPPLVVHGPEGSGYGAWYEELLRQVKE